MATEGTIQPTGGAAQDPAKSREGGGLKQPRAVEMPTPTPVSVEAFRPAITTRLARSQTSVTPDLLLWKVIEQSTQDLAFDNYLAFMDFVLCGKPLPGQGEDSNIVQNVGSLAARRFLPFTDTDAYRLLKVATEAFVMINCGVNPLALDGGPETVSDLLGRVEAETISDALWNEFWDRYTIQTNGSTNRVMPYLALIRRQLRDVPLKLATDIFPRGEFPEDCYGILRAKIVNPCLLELIWSYWHEQGMLVQTMNAVSRRFQNIRGPAERDPLALMEIDPLRPLNNLLWGYVQDEQHRLTVVRRAYEYDHHYGLTLEGKAVPELRPADSRSKFIEAFHNLLGLAWSFFKQDDDTTVKADGFPVLNALRDVHMLLAEGAHNQFGDLPTTARVEMLMQQWLLARPEFREVLPTRTMVAYAEPWMDRVDAMKKIQGWSDTSITHFHNLAVYGEQILLSVRYGAWNDTNLVPTQAAIWARFWRPQIQGYLYAYRTATGVDLTADMTNSQDQELRYAQPSRLLRQRLAGNGARPLLTTSAPVKAPASFRERRAARRPQEV